MEGLIAALVGWITTTDEIINLQTGLRIRNLTEEETRIEITYPSGDVEEYAGADADLILDRVENLAGAAVGLNIQLNNIASHVSLSGAEQ